MDAPLFQIYTGTDEVRISNFYVGGVPEEAEIMVLGPLEVNQGFTGCIEILKTSIQDETEVSVISSNELINSC